MKSLLAKFESKKMPFLQFQGLSTLNFGKFGTWEMGQIYKNENSEPVKVPKMTFFDHMSSPKFDFM